MTYNNSNSQILKYEKKPHHMYSILLRASEVAVIKSENTIEDVFMWKKVIRRQSPR